MSTRILIADESPTAQAFLGEMLRQEGYEALAVHSIEDARAACGGGRACVLILNVDARGEEPFAMLSSLKKDLPGLSVIALTNQAGFGTVVDAMRGGADDVLPAHSPPERLLAAVARAERQVSAAHQRDKDRAEIERLTSLSEQVIEHSPVPTVLLSQGSTIRHINRAMVRLLGLSDRPGIGESFASVVKAAAADLDERALAGIDRASGLNAPQHVSAVHMRLAGVDRYLDLDVTPLRETGTEAAVLVVLHDVSQWITGNQLLHSVVRDSADAIVVTDDRLIVRLWSIGAERIFGFRPDQIVGQPLAVLHPPDQQGADPGRLLADLADAPSSERKRVRRRRRDGSFIDVELTQFALADPQGRPVGVCEMSRDVTREIAHEREVEAVKEFYERIIDTISDGIRVIDAHARNIVLANKSHLDWVGASAGNVIGQTCTDVPWGTDVDGAGVVMDGLLDDALASGVPERRTYASRPATGGRMRWAEVAAYPMASPLGTAEHVVLVGRDVTDRVEMQASLAAERDRRDQVFTSAPVGILTTDAQGSIQFANPTIAEILGVLGPEQLVGVNLFHLRQVRDMDLTAKLWRVLSEGTHLHQDEVPWISAQGRDIVVNIRAEPLVVGEEITGLVAVAENVTEQVTLRRRLKATTGDLAMLAEIGELFEESRDPDLILQTILVGVTAGEGLGFNRAFFLATDPETRVLRGKYAIGPADREEAWRIWEDLKGTPHTLHDILSGYREAMMHDEVRINELAKDLVISLEDAENIAARAAIERRAFLVTDGRNHPMVPRELVDRLGTDSFAAVPLIFNDKVEGVILADNAITGKPITNYDLRSFELFAHQATLAVERARLYSELEHRLGELQEAHSLLKENQAVMLKKERLAAMGQTAAQVAHEIRNPLVAIGGFARNILRSLDEGDPKREFLRIIVDETTRLEKILRDVLEFAGPKPGNRAEVDLVHLIQRTVGIVREELVSRRIEARLDLPSEPVTVVVDPDQVRQVLQNLIHNAVEAMYSDGGNGAQNDTSGTLTIALEIGAGKAVVTISDTGGGLDEEAMKRVFEPFFTTKSHGTGLGLAICQQIIRDHDGEITVANQPGGGAAFSIAFPYARKEEGDGTHPRS